MRVACLMPTYGRDAKLLNNSLACFESQTYEDKALLILDDLGTLAYTRVETSSSVGLFSTRKRISSMGEKYNILATNAESFDVYMVWDDDDVYLEDYIASHVEAMKDWSKPSHIITAYTNPPSREIATGRFHGTVALTKDLYKKIGGWEDTRRGTFDQEFIAKLERNGTCGVPQNPPQYVYRWSTTQAQHSSGMIHEEAYYTYKPQSVEPVAILTPEFDDDTIRIKKYLNSNPT